MLLHHPSRNRPRSGATKFGFTIVSHPMVKDTSFLIPGNKKGLLSMSMASPINSGIKDTSKLLVWGGNRLRLSLQWTHPLPRPRWHCYTSPNALDLSKTQPPTAGPTVLLQSGLVPVVPGCPIRHRRSYACQIVVPGNVLQDIGERWAKSRASVDYKCKIWSQSLDQPVDQIHQTDYWIRQDLLVDMDHDVLKQYDDHTSLYGQHGHHQGCHHVGAI
jgi:hypothetical protein